MDYTKLSDSDLIALTNKQYDSLSDEALLELTKDNNTTYKEDFKIGLANVAKTFSKAGAGLGGLVLPQKGADYLYGSSSAAQKTLDNWANPENKEQTFGGKAFGLVSTLPAQIAAMPFSPFESSQLGIDKGASVQSAQNAAYLEASGNLAGFALPGMLGKTIAQKVVSGAAINSAQDTATRQAISTAMDSPESKEAFAPSLETAGLAAIPGAGIGLAHGILSRSKSPDNTPIETSTEFTPEQHERFNKSALNTTKVELDKEITTYKTYAEALREATTPVDRAKLVLEMEKSKNKIGALKEQLANLTKDESTPLTRDQVLDAHAEAEGITRAELDTQLQEKQQPTKQQKIDSLLDYISDDNAKLKKQAYTELEQLGIENAWALGRRKVDDGYVFSKEAFQEDIKDLYQGRTEEPVSYKEDISNEVTGSREDTATLFRPARAEDATLFRSNRQSNTLDFHGAEEEITRNLDVKHGFANSPEERLAALKKEIESLPPGDSNFQTKMSEYNELKSYIDSYSIPKTPLEQSHGDIAELRGKLNIDESKQRLVPSKGTNLKISTILPKELHSMLNHFVTKLGFVKDDIRVVYSNKVTSAALDVVGNRFTIYINDLAIAKKFDSIVNSNADIKALYDNLVPEKAYLFRQGLVVAHEMGHIFFYKMAGHYWRTPGDVQKLINHYTNWAKKNPEHAKVSGFLTPEQFLRKFPSEQEQVLSFKEYFANLVAKELFYRHNTFKKTLLDENGFSREHETMTKDQTNLREHKKSGEYSAHVGTKRKIESIKEGYTRFSHTANFMNKLVKGVHDMLEELFDLVGINKKFMQANKYIFPSVNANKNLIQHIIDENTRLNDLGMTIWDSLISKHTGYKELNSATYQEVKQMANKLFGYGSRDSRKMDYYPKGTPSLQVAIKDAIREAENGLVEDIPTLSGRITKRIFGKNGTAGIWFDNKIIQAVKTTLNTIQQESTQIHYNVLNGDLDYNGMVNYRTLEATKNKDSIAYHLENTKPEIIVDAMKVLEDSYDILSAEPKAITRIKEQARQTGTVDSKALLTEIQNEYKAIADKANLSGETRKAYDSFTTGFGKLYLKMLEAQVAMKKKELLPYHSGWYPAVRKGDFFFTLSKHGRVVYAQYFRTADMAQRIVDKAMKMGNRDGLEISSLMKRDEKYDVQSSYDLTKLYAEYKNKVDGKVDNDVDLFIEKLQTFGGKLGKHHEYRYNIPGHMGSELFYNKAELGESWRKGIENGIGEQISIIRKMKVTHALAPLLVREDMPPNTMQVVHLMHDMVQNKVPNILESFDERVDTYFEKIYLAARKPVATGLKRIGNKTGVQTLKNIDPDWQPPVSSFKKTLGTTSNLFYVYALMSRAAFLAGQVLTPSTTVPRVLLRETGFVDGFHTMASAMHLAYGKLPKDLMKDIIWVRENSDTFHPQFINDFNDIDWVSGIVGKKGKTVLDWMTGQRPATLLDAHSRYYSFVAAWIHNKKQGYSGQELINRSMDMTGEMAVLYGRAEKAPMFENLGTTGELLSPLQTYPQAQLANFVADIRHAKVEHNFKPVIATLLTTMLLGGVQGTIFVAEYEILRRLLGLEEYLWSPIEWSMGGSGVVDRIVSHGAISASTLAVTDEGLDMGSSIRANPILGGVLLGEKSIIEAMPTVGFATDTLSALGTVVKNRYTDVPEAERRDAALKLTPGGYKAVTDYLQYGSGTREYVPGKSGEAKVEQTGEKILAQALGTRTIKDSREATLMRGQKLNDEAKNKRISKQIELLADASKTNNQIMINKAVTKLRTYITDEESFRKLQAEMKERNIPEYIRFKFGTSGSMSVSKMRRLKEIMEMENE